MNYFWSCTWKKDTNQAETIYFVDDILKRAGFYLKAQDL